MCVCGGGGGGGGGGSRNARTLDVGKFPSVKKKNFYSNPLTVYLENLAMDSCGHFEMVLFFCTIHIGKIYVVALRSSYTIRLNSPQLS